MLGVLQDTNLVIYIHKGLHIEKNNLGIHNERLHSKTFMKLHQNPVLM